MVTALKTTPEVIFAPVEFETAAPIPAILEVDNLVKRYGQFTAVDKLSFSISEGEIFGFLGPNGAGKSTTIGIINGVIPPSGGTVRIGGYDLVREARKIKSLIGVVPQDLALYQTLSPYDNLLFFGGIYGLRGKLLKERIAEALDIVALTDRAKQPVETFSGGMKRRVNIAAALLHRPRLLILDEPTVGVDPQSRNYIFESIQRLNREYGMTIIYTSHYMEEVETLCERVAIVDHGKLVALDTKQNLIARLGGGVLFLGLSTVTPEIMARLEKLPNVVTIEEVTRAETDAEQTKSGAATVKCQTVNAQAALLEIIPTLNSLGLQLCSLEVGQFNLESVFLHLTGNRLRD
jgi:ABC-2 type transport system ATP-binding protein